MKFYNPFKWHVWQSPNTGYWYVRAWCFNSWNYLDSKLDDDWWSNNAVRKYCRFTSEVQAMTRLAHYRYNKVI